MGYSRTKAPPIDVRIYEFNPPWSACRVMFGDFGSQNFMKNLFSRVQILVASIGLFLCQSKHRTQISALWPARRVLTL
jgi:hypothetical protein